MTEEEFAVGVDAIIAGGQQGHAAHRALDLLWTRFAQDLPPDNPIRTATAKWMQFIEGDHAVENPYPLPRTSWFRRPLGCKLGQHRWIDTTLDGQYGFSADCPRCGAHKGSSGNPCP